MAASDQDSKLALIHNAKIYLSGQPDLTWMLYSTATGYIQEVGCSDPPLSRVTQDKQLDCGQRRVLPGLQESHIHVSSIGRAMETLDLHGCTSIKQFQRRIEEYAKKYPDRKWILGRRWEQDVMGRYPTKHDIDVVCADRPVMLVRVCGHVSVINSKAIEVVGQYYYF